MRCKKCDIIFECSNSTNCWCSKLPILKNIDSVDSCYCSDCLIGLISQQFDNKNSISESDKKTIADLGLPKKLIEGIDFNINDKGLYTFTSWYLLRRGYCCNNGCQNCPY